jgi:hypothetical protein
MNLQKLTRDKRAIKAFIGLSLPEFKSLVPVFEQLLFETKKNRKGRVRNVGGGRKGKLPDTESKLIFILFYMKVYPTFDVMGVLFDRDRGKCCRSVHLLLPILELTLKRKFVLPERKITSVEEFFQKFPEAKEVFLDGTERRVQRSKDPKKQNKTYSGKKKAHTRKNMVLCDSDKRVLVLTPTKAGRRHDKRLSDKALLAEHVPESVLIGADSGLQGIQHIHKNTWLPHKGTKKKPLTVKQREDNAILSHFRICVEHAIGGIKRFGVVTQVLRNKIGLFDDLVMVISAGLWNYHLSFQE